MALEPSLTPLSALIEAPTKSALLVGFDGTIAPIVNDPQDARPLPAAIAALKRLRGLVGSVAVLSGRPLEYLSSWIPSGIDLAGLDGLQRSVQGVVTEDPRVRAFAPVVESAAIEARRLLPGVLVESKSNISVALHWRRTPRMEEKVREVAAALAERHGLQIQEGRMVAELRPAIPIDKGVTAREFARGCDHVVFVGDDLADLLAFEALTDLLRARRVQSVILIAVQNNEAPDALVRLATLAVDGPQGVAALLDTVTSVLEKRRHR